MLEIFAVYRWEIALLNKTVASMNAGVERTWMCSQRVSVSNAISHGINVQRNKFDLS